MTKWIAVGAAALILAACGSSTLSTPTPVPPTSSATPIATAAATPAATSPPSTGVAGFAAKSVTFISTSAGWALGTAPCASGTCLALARTADGGHTWSSVPAPNDTWTLSPESGSGVHSVRFADANDGWVFGPDLWSTHDGGAHWTKQPLLGGAGRMWALEAAAGTANGAIYDSNGNIHIATTPVTSDSWQATPASLQVGAGPVPQVQIVLQGHAGWAVEIDRTVIAGARLNGGTWLSWTPPCSNDNGAATLAGLSSTTLAALCDAGTWGPSSDPAGWHAFSSTNDGSSFSKWWTSLPPSCCTGVFALPSSSSAVAATSGGLQATFNNGASWTSVSNVAVDTDLGFTTSTQGVAIDSQSGTLIMTYDGGHTWTPVSI